MLTLFFKKQYPDKFRYWNLSCVHWEAEPGEYQLYYPDINHADNISLCWSDMNYPKIEQYTIIQFCDLINTTDIEESDQPVDFILGGVIA